MQVVVFGAGAIGGFIAGALSRSGVETGVVARGAHLKAIAEHGLQIESELGAFTAKVDAASDLRDFSSPEYVLVTFKSHHWHNALPQFGDAIEAGTTVVTLQNGLPFWYERDRTLESVDPGGKIRATIPYAQIIGGVVHASGHIPRPGVVHQGGGRLYPIGEPEGSTTPRIRALSQMFETAGLTAPIESDIRRLVWRKLLGNLALNPISALTRATVRTLLDDPQIRVILRAIIEEGSRVARAGGIAIEFSAEERLEMARHIADVKTSMLQDLEAGKELELEPICGAVIELAARYGVPVPHVQTVYALTKLLASVMTN
ncbi:MAG TPA: 2-dehydropantoate 2-reductase [Candidatus Rubrimentiphilum sp.]|nr:2-dehydropantoate 2-reductase [Candidatus Rubrimentiphilum sp.]